MIVNNNIKSLNIQRQLSKNSVLSAKTNQKLATGIKINSASDDAAGLCISEKMKMQIRGLQKASTNSQDGISMVQVADGAMKEIHSILGKAYELSVKAINDTNNIDDKLSIGTEINELIKELEDIYNNTEFNNIKVLQGSKEKTIIKSEVVIVKEIIDEISYETKGELPPFITSGGLTSGYLNSNIVMDEIMYDRVNEKITYVDIDGNIKEVEQFKSDTGSVYKKDDIYKMNYISATKLEIKGDDGITYTVHRKYDEYKELQEHVSDLISFNNVNSSNVSDLVGTGFQTTCCSCQNRYSIKFIDDAESSFERTASHYTYLININGATSGKEIVERIMSGVSSVPTTNNVQRTDENGDVWDVSVPGSHLTGFAAEKDSSGNITGNLLIYDFPASDSKRRPNPSADMGIIKSGYYEGTVTKVEKEIEKVITTEVTIPGKDISLQIGANNGDVLIIDLPDTGLDVMKIDEAIVFSDNENIIKFSEKFKEAIDYISSQRSRMGAYENRLNHIIQSGNNASNNLLNAQSRINDTDMAKEIMKSSKYNIMQQSMYALLSQANDLPNKVLELLKVQ